jgi:hypothetical protein
MPCSPEDGDLVRGAPKVAVPLEVEEAVKTLIRWAGDDPGREGLLDTPKRVARAARIAQGCAEDPAHHLSRTFHEVGGYDEIVLLATSRFRATASIIRRRSSARRRSPICRVTRWLNFQAGASTARLCQAAAGPGTADRRSRRLHLGKPPA